MAAAHHGVYKQRGGALMPPTRATICGQRVAGSRRLAVLCFAQARICPVRWTWAWGGGGGSSSGSARLSMGWARAGAGVGAQVAGRGWGRSACPMHRMGAWINISSSCEATLIGSKPVVGGNRR